MVRTRRGCNPLNKLTVAMKLWLVFCIHGHELSESTVAAARNGETDTVYVRGLSEMLREGAKWKVSVRARRPV